MAPSWRTTVVPEGLLDTAIVRSVSPLITSCELTFRDRQAIDADRAVEQHAAYVGVLKQLGLEMIVAPAAPNLPDSVFVEDTAVVLDDVAIVARPGADSRAAETPAIAELLEAYREVRAIEPPGTLDGGDAVFIDDTLYVGHSTRTNVAGITQLRECLEGFGIDVRPIRVGRCLHLKSACVYLGNGTVLLNPRWVNAGPFEFFDVIETPPDEPASANALAVGGTVVISATHKQMIERIGATGRQVQAVEISEFEKAEGGVSCMSIVFRR